MSQILGATSLELSTPTDNDSPRFSAEDVFLEVSKFEPGTFCIKASALCALSQWSFNYLMWRTNIPPPQCSRDQHHFSYQGDALWLLDWALRPCSSGLLQRTWEMLKGDLFPDIPGDVKDRIWGLLHAK